MATKQLTEASYQHYLDNLYQNKMSQEQAFEDLVYLTNKARGQHVSETVLRNRIAAGTAGALIRKYDSIRFYTGYNDHK